ncbi:MAG TPA: alpha/beta hydrolase [Solirubrobacteraceae bacterium]|jgi:pimeloyl-ACP methyl ester carboxylesterase
MSITHSSDGTPIAYETTGDGPPVILVDGALCHRASGPSRPLAALLAEHFTVFTYDRRGRGDSGDTAPYAVEREVEDLEALIEEAGGSASVYGISSGAALALEAADRGLGIDKLVVYEAPVIVDDSRPPIPADYVPQLDALLAADRRGDAVRLFLRQVGLPGVLIALMRFMPAWGKLKAVAHTLPYDAATLSGLQAGEPLPAARWTGVTMPTLAVAGGKSPAWLHHGMRALAGVLPNAQLRVLEGQTHMVKPKALAPLLVDFFGEPAAQEASASLRRERS